VVTDRDCDCDRVDWARWRTWLIIGPGVCVIKALFGCSAAEAHIGRNQRDSEVAGTFSRLRERVDLGESVKSFESE